MSSSSSRSSGYGGKRSSGTTHFQLSVKLLRSMSADNTFDFTESRLRSLLSKNPANKNLTRLLNNYMSGDVAIAWRGGNPVFINLKT